MIRRGSRSPLLVGMSHVEAVQRATLERGSDLDVVNINQLPRVYRPPSATLNFVGPLARRPAKLFLSIGGNYHNILGLIENPIPFRIGDAEHGSVPQDETRMLVPEATMCEHFERQQAHKTEVTENIVRHFEGVPTFHLAPPPPVADLEGVRRRPGVFRKHLHLGFAPPELRRKLYDIEVSNLARLCERLGIVMIPAPVEAFDADGLLKAELCERDPTHGNTAYGHLVLDQIAALERTPDMA